MSKENDIVEPLMKLPDTINVHYATSAISHTEAKVVSISISNLNTRNTTLNKLQVAYSVAGGAVEQIYKHGWATEANYIDL